MVFNGIKITPNVYVSDFSFVRRTWRERLFTRPWRPLQKTKSVHDPKLYFLEKHGIFCSFETYSKIEKGGLDQLIQDAIAKMKTSGVGV